MKHRVISVLVLSLATALCACGGAVGLRVKTSMVKALPVESRIDLLDAENALFAAVDAVDEAHDDLQNAEAELDAAGDRIDEAKDQRKKARQVKDQSAEDVANLAITEAQERRKYLKVEMGVLRKDVEGMEADLDVARGRYELARAQAVKKAAMEGSQKLKVEDFEAQVTKLEERAKAIHDKADEMRKASEESKQAWTDSRTALAKASGGAQGSTWVE